MKSLGFAAIMVGVCAVAACTVSSGGGSDDDDDGSGGSSSSTTTSTTTSSTGGGGGAGGGDVCEGEVGAACVQCCADNNRTGAGLLAGATVGFCGCAASGPCTAQCDTQDMSTDVCLDNQSLNPDALENNADCVMCLDNLPLDEECFANDAVDACLEDADCAAYFNCANECPVE